MQSLNRNNVNKENYDYTLKYIVMLDYLSLIITNYRLIPIINQINNNIQSNNNVKLRS